LDTTTLGYYSVACVAGFCEQSVHTQVCEQGCSGGACLFNVTAR
jgi:hypothetical protein